MSTGLCSSISGGEFTHSVPQYLAGNSRTLFLNFWRGLHLLGDGDHTTMSSVPSAVRLVGIRTPALANHRPCLVAKFYKRDTVALSFVFDKYCSIWTNQARKIRLANYKQTVQLVIFNL